MTLSPQLVEALVQQIGGRVIGPDDPDLTEHLKTTDAQLEIGSKMMADLLLNPA